MIIYFDHKIHTQTYMHVVLSVYSNSGSCPHNIVKLAEYVKDLAKEIQVLAEKHIEIKSKMLEADKRVRREHSDEVHKAVEMKMKIDKIVEQQVRSCLTIICLFIENMQ